MLLSAAWRACRVRDWAAGLLPGGYCQKILLNLALQLGLGWLVLLLSAFWKACQAFRVGGLVSSHKGFADGMAVPFS